MIKFICNTGEEEFEAQIVGDNVIYMDGSKRIALVDENQDCEKCKSELDAITESARESARNKLRKERGLN